MRIAVRIKSVRLLPNIDMHKEPRLQSETKRERREREEGGGALFKTKLEYKNTLVQMHQ